MGLHGPGRVIHCSEPSCCNDGRYRKEDMAQAFGQWSVQVFQTIGNEDNCPGDDGQVPAQLLILEHSLPVAGQKEKVEVEIHPEQDHGDAKHHFDISAVIGENGAVADAKPSGAGGAEAVQHGIKQRHAAQHQKQYRQRPHPQVDDIENPGGAAGFGDDFAKYRPRHFRLHDMDGIVSHSGQDGHGEHQDSHAADQMGEAAPEQHGLSQRFHVSQNTCSSGGKARGCFKQGIDQ
ncbi:hypothetical protein DSECCO2_321120 [anaerobic digester metagenome]